ncbi:tRNA lysidine(34) synthetase TilS [Prochlorococcus marinus]|uniref:tRNA lysidine(34) synthetase TilS n=1 Tax=Prochlorococcus TaxID=1218 RepID=UPI0007B3C1B5|nr:tRNA lysidine(34) synthetase TilS [Prochlorococcus marinus]KZR76942.1 tRNA(Ile)-lysidine synthase [Prochlorococcus marinus str. MIT 1323]
MASSSSAQLPWSAWHARLHHKLLANPDLLPAEASLLIAVSGGQDSMALLGLLIDLQRKHGWSLEVWHGDHNWHKQSATIATELKNWCESHNLSFWSDQAKPGHTNKEATARHWRYEQLTLHAERLSSNNPNHPCRYVLTGHTSSDRAETLILNLARGTDLAGLSSMRQCRPISKDHPHKNVQLIRPLLGFSREDTALICSELGLPIWLDPANSNPDFSRNRVRQEVLPVLESLHPGCSLRMAALAERLNHHHADQQAIAMLALNNLSKQNGLCRKDLAQLPITARTTLLAYWLKRSGAPSLPAVQLEQISQSIAPGKPPGSLHLAQGWKVQWQRNSVQLEHHD